MPQPAVPGASAGPVAPVSIPNFDVSQTAPANVPTVAPNHVQLPIAAGTGPVYIKGFNPNMTAPPPSAINPAQNAAAMARLQAAGVNVPWAASQAANVPTLPPLPGEAIEDKPKSATGGGPSKLVQDVADHKSGADAALRRALGLPPDPQADKEWSSSGQPLVGKSGQATTDPMEEYINEPRRMGQLQKDIIEAQAERQRAVAQQAAQDAKDQMARQAGYASAEADRQRQAQVALAKINQVEQDAANMPLNDKGFLSRNPGAIMAAVGSIFGGMLAARTGGKNEALESLNNMIAKDAQDQKDAYNQQRNKASAMRSTYGQMLQQFGDERSATSATELANQTAVNARLKAMVMSSDSEDLRDRGKIALQLGEGNSNRLRADLLARQQMLSMMQPGTGTRTGVGKKGKQDLDKTDEKFVPGFGGYARTKEAATKLNETLSSFDTLDSTLNEVEKYWKDTNALDRFIDPKQKEAMRAKLNLATSEIKNNLVKAGAALSPSEEAMLPIRPGEGDDFFNITGSKEARIQATREFLRRKRADLERNAGIVKAVEQANPATNRIDSQLTGDIAKPTPGVRDIGTPVQ
jgi:hypothetical protein